MSMYIASSNCGYEFLQTKISMNNETFVGQPKLINHNE